MSEEPRTYGVEREIRFVDRYGREHNFPVHVLEQSSKSDGRGIPMPGYPRAHLPVHERTASIVEVTTPVAAVGEMESVLRDVQKGAIAWGRAQGGHMLFHSIGLTVPVGGFAGTDLARYRAFYNRNRANVEDLHSAGDQPHYGTVSDPDERVRIASGFGPIEHVLLGFFASSPYFEGRDSGMASSRYGVFDKLPTVEPLPAMRTEREYLSWADMLLKTVRKGQGYSGKSDLTLVHPWTRPTPHQSVEPRVADSQGTLPEIILLSKIAWGWAEYVRQGGDVSTFPTHQRRAMLAEAARHGITAKLAHPVTGEPVHAASACLWVVDRVEPVLKDYGIADNFRESAVAVLRRGNGAARARRLHAVIHKELKDAGVAACQYELVEVVRGHRVIPAIERRALTAALVVAAEVDDLTPESQPVVRDRTEALLEEFKSDPNGLPDGMETAMTINRGTAPAAVVSL